MSTVKPRYTGIYRVVHRATTGPPLTVHDRTVIIWLTVTVNSLDAMYRDREIYSVPRSRVVGIAVCVCCLHIKPLFLPNDISTPKVRADSSS